MGGNVLSIWKQVTILVCGELMEDISSPHNTDKSCVHLQSPHCGN